MSSGFTEANFENSIIELFESMGYTHLYGPDVERDYTDPLIEDELQRSLQRINRRLPAAAITEALYKIKNYEAGTVLSKNEVFMDYLQNGVTVSYSVAGKTESGIVYLVDYSTPANNSFIIANQWTYQEYETKRPDVIVFLNGMPVVLMELKSPKAVGAPTTITSLCTDIVEHYENYRQYEQTGKAMIVAYSRPIAVEMYRKILELRPEWKEKVKIVMTGSNQDPPEWKDLTGNKAYREDLARQFKDNKSAFKVAIIVDMWLTGFDVPSLSTMYVFKPMKGHNLMQAIARVNRVYKDKEGGLIVDYIGIASALKAAMKTYTKRDNENYGDMDVSRTAYKKFREKLQVCRELLYGFDYSEFMTTQKDLRRTDIIRDGVNFLAAVNRQETRKNFIKEAYLMKQAYSLSKSVATEEEGKEEVYFETVRSVLVKVESPGHLSLSSINAQVNELLKQSVHSDGVINLFSDVDSEFNLFNPDYIREISRMPEKNLAVELLKKLIAEQVKTYQRTNVVKSEKFSEMLNRRLKLYLNGMLTNEQVIDELVKMAEDISNAHKQGNDLGLTDEEMAFYDALTEPQAVKDFYTNDQLIAITRELTQSLRKSRTIDWEKKESARAGMRMMIKRLLKKYKYPPEGVVDAVQTVIRQCEMWTDNQDYYDAG